MITTFSFILIFIFFCASFLITLFSLDDIKNKKTESIVRNYMLTMVFFVPILLISYIWVFPNIYTVTDCGKVEEKIMINPFLSFDYGGNNCYVINNSNHTLYVDTSIYGKDENDDIEHIKQIIKSKTTVKLKISRFSDLFELPATFIKTKAHNNQIYYYLGCEELNR